MKPISTRSSTSNIHKPYLLYTQCVYSFIQLSQRTKIFSLDSIKHQVLVTTRQRVCCEVETEPFKIMKACTQRLTHSSGMKETFSENSTSFWEIYNTYRCTLLIEGRTSGRVMAQGVNPRSLTAEAWVQSQFSPCKICGKQTGTGTCFL